MSNVVDDFHKYFYGKGLWAAITYMGYPIFKNPFDLQIYHELIYALRPDLIIETGSAAGGSALWLAHQMDNMNIEGGRVISIDTMPRAWPSHSRLEFWVGSSTSHDIASDVEALAADKNPLVILDSNHEFFHVYRELEIYSKLVKQGGYIIVEDSNINGHPVEFSFDKGGPFEAIELFLSKHPEFSMDKSCEKLEFSFNPNGFLRRNK